MWLAPSSADRSVYCCETVPRQTGAHVACPQPPAAKAASVEPAFVSMLPPPT